MIRLQTPTSQAQSNKPLRFALIVAVCVTLASVSAFAQLAPNQTHGFGADPTDYVHLYAEF
jgi:hypothetical protein